VILSHHPAIGQRHSGFGQAGHDFVPVGWSTPMVTPSKARLLGLAGMSVHIVTGA
jgi:hypothetical protein